jgi:N6-adenosine-specific RNA methylase IME4
MNAALLAELEIEKSKRDRAKAGRAVGGDATPSQKANRLGHTSDPKRLEPKEPKIRATERAAKTAKVSVRKVKQALAIQKTDPALAQKVLSGEVTLTKASHEVAQKQRAEKFKGQQDLPSDKYRILYVDPPWSYGDTREGLPTATGATAHYPAMSIDELCRLPIATLAEDNAVLFLWVTSPLLDECWPVIAAWGFTYKASFIWDKMKHNLGHYNSVRHEFLLICTRGSCLPDSSKLINSVQSIEKSRKHSEKPEEFRKIIDTMYTVGRRIELFARTKVDGWDSWGNEI